MYICTTISNHSYKELIMHKSRIYNLVGVRVCGRAIMNNL